MYCVIQEIELKKENEHGYYKELKAGSFTFTIKGITETRYTFNYGDEKFRRPIRKAYKVSIHESRRINGVVTKKQYVVTTVDYYSLAEYWIGDCLLEKKIDGIAESLGTDSGHIWELINAKADPLQERIKAEFKKTEEYRTNEKHNKIIKRYNNAKSKFAKDYNCDDGEYDFIYDVFGSLKNQDYLDKIVAESLFRKEYEEKSRSYRKEYYSNYSNSGNVRPAASLENKDIYKQFYRELSKKFHPDVNPDKDTSNEMKLLNKLKNEWGV